MVEDTIGFLRIFWWAGILRASLASPPSILFLSSSPLVHPVATYYVLCAWRLEAERDPGSVFEEPTSSGTEGPVDRQVGQLHDMMRLGTRVACKP